ncbi:MAG: nucleotidyltransferase domain-containing protein [Thermoprotei archaeon]|nr:MAG: nucleotidyltransferase domain-containing protein [Thermoprotei archaeon]
MRLRMRLQNVPSPYRRLIERFVELLLSRFKDRIVSIALFGSIARGDFKKTSDVDILIIMKDLPKSRMKRYELIAEVLDELETIRDYLLDVGIYTGISPVILDVNEAKYFRPLYLDLVEDGIILYDKDDFLYRLLSRMQEYIARFEGKRIWMGRRWMWFFKKGNPLIELCGVKLID